MFVRLSHLRTRPTIVAPMTVESAEPILASALYKSQLGYDNASDEEPKRTCLKTGCAAIDEVLQEGLAYGDGGICCISGEQDSGINEVN